MTEGEEKLTWHPVNDFVSLENQQFQKEKSSLVDLFLLRIAFYNQISIVELVPSKGHPLETN